MSFSSNGDVLLMFSFSFFRDSVFLFVCDFKGTTTDNSVCSNNIILNRLLLVEASALVPLFSGFDRARMRTCVFNYIWWFSSLSCCIDIRYDLWSLKCIDRSAPEFDIANYIGTETPTQVMQHRSCNTIWLHRFFFWKQVT